jgi:F-type H+-transporting ATPase subunit gamma
MREVQAEGQQVLFFPSGKKAGSTLRFRKLEVGQAWSGFSDRPAYRDAQAMAHAISDAFTNGDVDRVVIVYNAFVSPLVQKVTVRDVLPVPQEILERGDDDQEEGGDTADFGGAPDYIYEPEPEEILARLLPVYVETELYRALLESAASEQGARMTAMRNASKAAGELIDSLTLAMNRARQAEITQEILEVVAGADALTG